LTDARQSEGAVQPFPGSGPIARETKERRREEVLEAALAEFAELGLHGASVERIARRVGISQPYVYRLFSTKRNLFQELVFHCFRNTLERRASPTGAAIRRSTTGSSRNGTRRGAADRRRSARSCPARGLHRVCTRHALAR
jgi:AcrR family transcriptional regulator